MRHAVRSVAAVAAVLACGCAGTQPASVPDEDVAPPPRAPRPRRTAARLFSPIGPPATHYEARPSRAEPGVMDALDPLARRLVEACARGAAAAQLPPPLVDERMVRVALEVAHASVAARPPPHDAMSFFLGHHGLVTAEPALFILAGAPESESMVEARLVRTLGGLFRQGVWNRLGVAVVRRPQELIVVVALFEQHVELRALPRGLPSAGRARVVGRLLRDFRDVQLVVTTPSGVVRRLRFDQRADAFTADVPCAEGDGRYQVEIVGSDAVGPNVLANFPLFCGVALPADVTAHDDEEAQDADPAEIEQELLALMNTERAAAGLAPVAWDNRLAAIARSHSREMARTEIVAHVSPTTGDVAARVKRAGLMPDVLGENVGLAESARQAHRGFLASPGHRANVLGAKVTHVGIGVIPGCRGGGAPPLFITEIFAAGI